MRRQIERIFVLNGKILERDRIELGEGSVRICLEERSFRGKTDDGERL